MYTSTYEQSSLLAFYAFFQTTVLTFFFCCWYLVSAQAQVTDLSISFDRDNTMTSTYPEVIDFYQKLAASYPDKLLLTPHGTTDSGHPLHTAVVSLSGDFNPVTLRQQGKTILLVNNAIHPGEPCGVEASMLLLRDYLQDQNKRDLLNDLVIVVIPYYNIGGGLNRGGLQPGQPTRSAGIWFSRQCQKPGPQPGFHQM